MSNLSDCWGCCECPTSCEGECTWEYYCEDQDDYSNGYSNGYYNGYYNGGGSCYWVLVEDCGESNDSGCQCDNRICEWEWESTDVECNGVCTYNVVTGEVVSSTCGDDETLCACPPPFEHPAGYGYEQYRLCVQLSNSAYWTQLSDCDCEDCTCPTPADLSPIPGQDDGTIVTTDCSGESTGGSINCDCDIPTDSNASDGETTTTPCYGGPCDTSSASALSNRTFGLVNKIPQVRNSRKEIRDSSAIKVTRKGVSKVYLNVKAIKRKRMAMARKVASRRQRMR